MKSLILSESFSLSRLVLISIVLSTAGGRILDLSYDYDSNTLHWPTTTAFQLTVERAEIVKNEYWYAANRFLTGEHSGTHMDAPYHFYQYGWTVEQIPVDRLIAPAVVVNISERTEADPDSTVLPQDLEAWESEHGLIPNGSLVMAFTGWGQKWPNKTEYFGSNESDPSTFHFPGFSEEAARWLANNRTIVGVGIDTASVDRPSSFKSHVIFSESNLYALENVANLHLLPPKGTTIIALPMKIKKGTGSPCRVVAILSDSEDD